MATSSDVSKKFAPQSSRIGVELLSIVALLCGEPGIGKSRVTKTWLDLIADEPHIVIRYQCSPHHTSSPFYPIINQLKRAAHFEREDTPDLKLGKLEAVLSQAGAATLADARLYAALLSIPTDKFKSLPDLTPQRQRELTIAALLRQLRDLALTRPVVIVFEDAHWIDSSTFELLSRCIASIKAARVFVVISFRPEFFPTWLDESHVTTLRLTNRGHHFWRSRKQRVAMRTPRTDSQPVRRGSFVR